jgi:hypothetical protein
MAQDIFVSTAPTGEGPGAGGSGFEAGIIFSGLIVMWLIRPKSGFCSQPLQLLNGNLYLS